MTMLHVERLGGLAGYGGARARIRSCGCLDTADLPAAARETVEALLRSAGTTRAPTVADGFRYRLRGEIDGVERSIEVPEAAVPAAVVACVKDEFA